MKINKSFYDWCIKNNHQDWLMRWDYSINGFSPKDISYGSNIKCYFNCDKHNNHKPEGKYLNNITKRNVIICGQCNSFAQYNIDCFGENFLEKYWSSKNTINPWLVAHNSAQKVWIKCQNKDYHEDYLIGISHFFGGQRCPYCTHHNGKVHPLDSLGALYPEVKNIWSSKNTESPYEYAPMSNQFVWWKCPEGNHEDYRRKICNAQLYEFRCPLCTIEQNESILQGKVRKYLESFGYKINHEYECTLVPCNPKYKGSQGSMPFDNEIEDLKLIIEVHGKQHYETESYSSIWREEGLTPEQQLHKRKLYDRYKRYIAFKNSYEYLSIPYWLDDKQESYKVAIDNKIKKILNISALHKKVS